MNLVIDACVFSAAALWDDVFHPVASEFLLEARLADVAIYEPVLVLAEVAGVVSRVRNDHAPADAAVLRIEHFPRTRLRVADGLLAKKAARLAARHKLSGADAHYVAVALEYGCQLITFDQELLRRAPPAVPVLTPAAWLRR